jgi:tetratricopeptide (TPR) repeat protein
MLSSGTTFVRIEGAKHIRSRGNAPGPPPGAVYRQQCRACHEPAGCSLPEPARRAQSREDSCIQCHMPMSSSSDIIHIASTDHRIPRTPPTRMADPDPADTGLPLVLLNGDETGSEGFESLQRELAIAVMAEVRGLPDTPPVRLMGSRALGLLEEALAHRPDDLVARCAQAEALALLGRRQEAIQLDQAVLESTPSCEQALDDALFYGIELGDHQAALALARRAVALNPGSATFHERLAYAHLQRRDWGEALQESRAALRLNPFLRFARMFVVQCLLHQHDLQRAEEEFATLTGLNPTQRESLGRWFAAQRPDAGL